MKRRRTWGTIRSATKAKHVIRWHETVDGERVRRCLTFHGTYREACRKLAQLEVEHGGETAKRMPTIGQAREAWWVPWNERRIASGKVKERSTKRSEEIWRLHVEPRWGGVSIAAVHPAEVQEWLLTLTPDIAKRALGILRKTVDFAVQYDYLQVNKFAYEYDRPIEGQFSRVGTVYRLDQAESMLDRLRGSSIEAAYILAAFGGTRTGESLGVKVEDVRPLRVGGVDFAAVELKRQMLKDGNEPTEDGDLKTKGSVRSTLVPEPYGARLLEIAEERRAMGHEFLSCKPTGQPINRSCANYRWRRDAGDDCIPFANLRNSWRTFCKVEWDIDWETLERLMGHELPGVSGKHYIRMSVDDMAKLYAKSYRKRLEENGPSAAEAA
ncbi:hypothetical protein GMI70_03010 [Eggerthellaceae bacterium zg-893]|nr:hypothetical protein [Eggerthellaceae bacterium zg-893]